MGILLRSDVDASAYASKAVTAVTRGLRGMWYFDTDKGKVANDFSVVSDAQSGVVGDPVIGSDGTRFSAAGSYLQTDIAEPNAFSFAIVMRALYPSAEMTEIAKRCHAFGTYSNAMSGLALGYSTGPGRLSFGRVVKQSDGTAAVHSAPLAPTDFTRWRLVRGVWSASRLMMTCRDETEGKTAASIGSGVDSVIKNASPLRIGGVYSSTSQAGPVMISQLRFYDEELTDSEFTDVVAEMRRYELTHNSRTV